MEKKKLARVVAFPYAKIILPCLGINVFLVLLIFLLLGRLPPVIPLFYGLPQGEEQLIDKFFLVLPSIIAIVIIGLNSLMTKFLKNQFLERVLVGLMVVVTILALITSLRIFFLIGNI